MASRCRNPEKRFGVSASTRLGRSWPDQSGAPTRANVTTEMSTSIDAMSLIKIPSPSVFDRPARSCAQIEHTGGSLGQLPSICGHWIHSRRRVRRDHRRSSRSGTCMSRRRGAIDTRPHCPQRQRGSCGRAARWRLSDGRRPDPNPPGSTTPRWRSGSRAMPRPERRPARGTRAGASRARTLHEKRLGGTLRLCLRNRSCHRPNVGDAA